MNNIQAKEPPPRRPVIAICLAVYQAEAFIEATLSSIAAQSLAHFRCVISDDASEDDTLSICQHVALHDTRFEVINNSRRLGWIGNVNRVLQQVSEEYFMIASHDDELAETYLEELVEALDSCPTAVVAYSDMRVVVDGFPDTVTTYSRLERCVSPFQRAAGVISEQGTWWIPYRGLVRRNLLGEAPRLYYNRAGEFSADLPWVLNLAFAGSFVRLPRLLLTKYKMPGSVSSQWTFTPREHAAVLECCARMAWSSGLPVTQRSVLLLLVLTRFARKLAWDGWQLARGTMMGSASKQHDAH